LQQRVHVGLRSRGYDDDDRAFNAW